MDLIIDQDDLIKYKIENKKIIFLDTFNEPIDNLPDNIEEIIFGNDFNQSVNNLPINLKKIYFADKFNQSLDLLPNGLEEIEFSPDSEFQQLLDNLPNSLKVLKFGFNYNRPLENLPEGLKILQLSYRFKHSMLKFPLRLTKFLIPIKAPPPPFGKHLHELGNRYKDITQMYLC